MNCDNTTNLSCVKILIRLARTSKAIAERIMSYSSLVKFLFNQFAKVGTHGDRKLIRIFYLDSSSNSIEHFRLIFTDSKDKSVHFETIPYPLFLWRTFH